eukprot:434995_1
MTSLKILSTIIMSGIMNVMGSDTIDTKIQRLYDGLLNGGSNGDANTWVHNFFAPNIKYCYYLPTGPVCPTTDEFKQIMGNKYFGTTNLIKHGCNVIKNQETPCVEPCLSASISCNFIWKGPKGACAEQLVEEFVNYNPHGTLILQYYTQKQESSKPIACPDESSNGLTASTRRLIQNYLENTIKKQ